MYKICKRTREHKWTILIGWCLLHYHCIHFTNAQIQSEKNNTQLPPHAHKTIIWGHRHCQRVEFKEGAEALQEVSSQKNRDNTPWPTNLLMGGFSTNACTRKKTSNDAWARSAVMRSWAAWSTQLSSAPLGPPPTATTLTLTPTWITSLSPLPLPLRVGVGRGRHQRSPPPLINGSLSCVWQRQILLQALPGFLTGNNKLVVSPGWRPGLSLAAARSHLTPVPEDPSPTPSPCLAVLDDSFAAAAAGTTTARQRFYHFCLSVQDIGFGWEPHLLS